MNIQTSTRAAQRTLQQVCRQQHVSIRTFAQPKQQVRDLHVRPSLLRKQLGGARVANQIRHESNDSRPPSSLTDRPETDAGNEQEAEALRARKAQEPAYEMTFTCRKCIHRSSHRITKQAYHYGTTLITCPSCKNRHLISDHMKIFSDKSVTLEDILREKGEFMKKGKLGEDGNVEFYEDAPAQDVPAEEPLPQGSQKQ